jgi:hypothetical protein
MTIFSNVGSMLKPSIADKDIEVGKIFEIEDGKYLSLLMKTEYPLNELLTEKEFGMSYEGKGEYRIYEGLHAYSYEIALRKYRTSVSLLSRNAIRACKCIIPKGTKYYTNSEEYVSLALKRVEN